MAEKRSDEFYEIDALSKGLAVLEALEGTAFEPIKIDRLVNRCAFAAGDGLSKDFVMRCLKTFRIRRYAVTNERGEWLVGPRFIRLANALATVKGDLEKLEARKVAVRRLYRVFEEIGMTPPDEILRDL